MLRLGVVLATLVVVVGGAFLAATAVGGWVASWRGEQGPTVRPGLEVRVVINPGSSARQIGQKLADAGVVATANDFEAAAGAANAEEDLKAGTYVLTTGMEPEAVVEVLVAGPDVGTLWITIPEGLRLTEILDRIASQTSLTVAELEAALRSGSVTSSLRPADAPADLVSWEGLLFADTYQLGVDWKAVDVLELLAHTMEERYLSVDWSDPRVAGLSPYERLVAASLVEAETRVDADRPLVATVIFNRLEAGMPLQIDAAVLYGLGVRGRAPTLEELEIDTPYNTYLHTGLPPTAVGAPGAASLAAVAAPAPGDYLYYVRTGVDGSHSFTSDYDEFLRWKEEAEAQGLG